MTESELAPASSPTLKEVTRDELISRIDDLQWLIQTLSEEEIGAAVEELKDLFEQYHSAKA
jgi:soluble cytochrome b562